MFGTIASVIGLVVALIFSIVTDSYASVSVRTVDPMRSKILPSTVIEGDSTDTIDMIASRGEYEPGSFVVRSTEHLEDISFIISDLVRLNSSAVIPRSSVDLRIVKPWFQSYYSWNEIGISSPVDFRQSLTPELLVKDDSLVRVDEKFQKNYIRSGSDYVWINEPALATPTSVSASRTLDIRDTQSLSLFDIEPNTARQIWVTVKVPDTTPAGVYSGCIDILSNGAKIGRVQVRIQVTSFTLLNPSIQYGIYYRGTLDQAAPLSSSEKKSAVQMLAELRDMKEHGIAYPSVYQPIYNPDSIKQVLSLRRSAGFVNGPLYYLGLATSNSYLGLDETKRASNLQKLLSTLNDSVSEFEYYPVFVYGRDEAWGSELEEQRALWEVVHQMGNKVFVAGFVDYYSVVGDLLDVHIKAGMPSKAEADNWHRSCNKIFSYNNPQSGPENPFLWRLNFGMLLWANEYDGAFPYTYQHCFGSCYNDIDDKQYRDHMLTYPSSDGVLGTIAWEGFREGVDDVRYLTTLVHAISMSNSSASIAASNYLRTLKEEILMMQQNSGKYNVKSTINLDAIRLQIIKYIEELS